MVRITSVLVLLLIIFVVIRNNIIEKMGNTNQPVVSNTVTTGNGSSTMIYVGLGIGGFVTLAIVTTLVVIFGT